MRDKTKGQPPREAPRFANYLTEARKHFNWLPLPFGNQGRLDRLQALTQMEIAQQLRLNNLLVVASTPGMEPRARDMAVGELFEPDPADPTQGRLRADVALALGMGGE